MDLLDKLDAYARNLQKKDPVYQAFLRLKWKVAAQQTAIQQQRTDSRIYLQAFIWILKEEGVTEDQINNILKRLNVRREDA